MRSRYIVAIPLLLLVVGVAALMIPPARADNTTGLTISGTGSFTTSVVTVTTPIDSCVTLGVRSPETGPNSAAFTGIITTNTPGTVSTHFLQNSCIATPTPTLKVSRTVYTLNDVTVSCGTGTPTCPAGVSKTGGLVLTAEYTQLTVGSAPTQSVGQLSVSGSGDLKGITGHAVTMSTVVSTGGASVDYWIQLTFANSGE